MTAKQYRTRDGATFTASSATELISAMHTAARLPCEDDEVWMLRTSNLYEATDGVAVRVDTDENFVSDLLAFGLLK